VAAHVENSVVVRAPRALAWELAISDAMRHAGGRHEVLRRDEDRRSVTLRIVTPPDEAGRSWTYDVERIADPERHTVYARRGGNPHWLYAHAWWAYEETQDGTVVRCVQDFEMAPGAPVDDAEMARVLERATRASLERMAAHVERVHAERAPTLGEASR